MRRTQLNFIIDAIAFIGFVFLTTTGVMMKYILPPGSGHYSTIWNMDRHTWGDIHFWIAVVFFSILALHLVLHWRWIVSVITGRPGESSGLRAGLGLVGLIVVIALAVSPLFTPVEKDLSLKKNLLHSGQESNRLTIYGSMTLKEVAEITGTPIDYIIGKLQLPESVSTEEKLGVLKGKYGFELNNVREIVKEYRNRATQ